MSKLNEILNTQEILVIIVALDTAASAYEAESNRTPLPDVRTMLIARTKTARAVRGRFVNLADSTD